MSKYVNAADAAEKIAEKHGIPLGDLVDTFAEIPAAAVVEVRHGRWIRKEDDSCYWYECSECGEKLAKTQWGNDYFSAYCPNCGSLMDKEEPNEL